MSDRVEHAIDAFMGKVAVPIVDGPHKGASVSTTFVFWEAMGYWHPDKPTVELIDTGPCRPLLPLGSDVKPEDEASTVTAYRYVRCRKDGYDFWVLKESK